MNASGTARMRASSAAITVSIKVTGKRWRMMVVTGSFRAIEVPRSPVNTLFTK